MIGRRRISGLDVAVIGVGLLLAVSVAVDVERRVALEQSARSGGHAAAVSRPRAPATDRIAAPRR